MNKTESGWLEWLIASVCKTILWITSCVIFAILTTNTVLRYSMGSSLQWANELPELLFPWLVMAGIVLATLHGSHIATTFLVESVAPSVRRLMGVACWSVVAVMYAMLSWSTYGMLDIVADERSPILQVPGSVTYGCMLGGMLMLSLLALQSAWRVWQGTVSFPATADTSSGASNAQG